MREGRNAARFALALFALGTVGLLLACLLLATAQSTAPEVTSYASTW